MIVNRTEKKKIKIELHFAVVPIRPEKVAWATAALWSATVWLPNEESMENNGKIRFRQGPSVRRLQNFMHGSKTQSNPMKPSKTQ